MAAIDGSAIERAAMLLAGARRMVALTGAGISTESGVPGFRGPGGLWSRYDPEEFAYPRFVASAEARRKYWQWGKEFYPRIRDAGPNGAHRALAELERRGKLRCLITQNIDGLHQRAGSKDVIELHGNALTVACLDCGKRWPRAEVHGWLLAGIEDPRCDACRGILKPTTISFGQPMPEAETRRAFAEAAACDLFLAVGSSLAVLPAAALVPAAKQARARLVLLNLTATDFDPLADVVIAGRAGETLPRLLQTV